MPSPVCIILSPVFWKIRMMCDFPTEDTHLDTWTGYTTNHLCALVTISAGLFLVVTLKRHTLQRHHPTLAAWQLHKAGGYEEGVQSWWRKAELRNSPHLNAHTAEVRAADYLGSKDHCGLWRRMEGAAVTLNWQETEKLTSNTFTRTAVCFLWNSRCEQERDIGRKDEDAIYFKCHVFQWKWK